MLSSIYYEVLAALRSLKRSSAFLVIATVSLALGVGVNTAVVQVAMAVLFPPSLGPDAEELVNLYHRDFENGRLRSISYPDYEFYRDKGEVFSDLAAYIRRSVRISIDGRPDEAMMELVSGNYMSMLRVKGSAATCSWLRLDSTRERRG